MSKPLSDKWALVTGSSRGIGQQIALGLAQLGCNIVVHGRKLENTKPTLDLLVPFNNIETHAVAGDLSTQQGINLVVNGVNAHPGNIDILYNNAAVIGENKTVTEFTMEDWQFVFQVNVFATAQLINAFLPGMIERGYGHIINLSSGIADQPNLAPYSASKAAIDKYTKDLRVHLKGTGVRAAVLDPGWLKTDMGGENAFADVETVLPGALMPVLVSADDPHFKDTVVYYRAQKYKLLALPYNTEDV